MANDYARLGALIRTRREVLQLSQADVAARGGPSDITLRRIERGDPNSYRAKTRRQLERALQWWHGSVDAILEGTLTEDDVEYLINRPWLPERSHDDHGHPITVKIRHDYGGQQEPGFADVSPPAALIHEVKGWRVVGEPVIGDPPEIVVNTPWGRTNQYLQWLVRRPASAARDDALRALSVYLGEVAADDQLAARP